MLNLWYYIIQRKAYPCVGYWRCIFEKIGFSFNFTWNKRVVINSFLIFKTGNSEYKIIVGNLWIIFKFNFNMSLYVIAMVSNTRGDAPRHAKIPLLQNLMYERKLNGPAVKESQLLSELCNYCVDSLFTHNNCQYYTFLVFFSTNEGRCIKNSSGI